MKPILSKIGQLTRYLGQARDIVEAAPGHVGEIRTAVRHTRQEIQKLRAEVLSSVIALKTDGAIPVADTLADIEECTAVLGEAGYVMDAVELEMGVVQRWVVHLKWAGEVSAAEIVALAQRQPPGSTSATLLKAIVSVQQMAVGMGSGSLVFTSITVYLGPSPSVRIGWESPTLEPASGTSAVSTAAESVPVPPSAPSSSLASGFGGSTSFFESRASVPTPPPATPPAVASSPVAPSAAPAPPDPTPVASADWRTDALARFKKMPDLRRRS